jgi:DNA-binding transcriptional ArsR family regulator
MSIQSYIDQDAEQKQRARFLDREQTQRILDALEPSAVIQAMADIFKVLSDPTRLKIVTALQEGELCVSDIATLTGFSQSSVSHHLKTLRLYNLVRFRRKGKLTFYSLADTHVSALLAVARDHARE